MSKASLFGWYGGKKGLAEDLIGRFSDTAEIFVEPYFGSGAVFFALEENRFKRYIINDLDKDLVNFLQVLTGKEGEAFIEKMLTVVPNAETFRLAKIHEENGFSACSALERATYTYIMITQSFNNCRKNFRRGMDTKVYQKRIANSLPLARERLMNSAVEIRCEDALSIIKEFKDNEKVQFMLDPPYLWSTRVTTKAYYNEMCTLDHAKMLNEIKDMKAKAVLCGYHSEWEDFYDRILLPHGWSSELLKDVPKPSANGGGKKGKRALEWLWTNEIKQTNINYEFGGQNNEKGNTV